MFNTFNAKSTRGARRAQARARVQSMAKGIGLIGMDVLNNVTITSGGNVVFWKSE